VLDDTFDAQERIGVQMASTQLTVAPGSGVAATITLHNRGARDDGFSLSVRGIPTNWVSMLPPMIRLSPGEQREVTLVIQPPDYPHAHAGRYPLKIQVSSQEAPGHVVDVDCTLTVASLEVQGRIGVLLASTIFSVAPGSSTTIPLVLINRGLEDDFFQLSVQGIPAGWVSTPAAVTRLSPGQQTEATLTIQPPRSAQSRAGRHRFVIQVKSQGVPGQAAEAQCMLTIAAFTQFNTELNPPRLQAGQTGWVAVENLGNVQQTYTVTWQSHNDELAFEPGPTQTLKVPAGKVGMAEFRAAPRRRPIFGEGSAYAYSAFIQSAENETQNLMGDVASAALMPIWVLPLLGLVGIAAACLLAFVIFRGLAGELAPTQTAVAALTPSPGPGTAEPAPTQTVVAALTPSPGPGTAEPTGVPPTEVPTAVPTEMPTDVPTDVPTEVPTEAPTGVPTEIPTTTPLPTDLPTDTPEPTEQPTEIPTDIPTETPAAPPIQDQGILAFESSRDGNPEIYSLNTANWDVFRLTIDPAVDTQPAWSPDGSRVAFATNQSGDFEIVVMNADGTAVTNLTNNPADDVYPTWSPDGDWIAFTTDRDGNQEIYVMRVDGSEPHNVSNSPGQDYQPSWFASRGLFSSDERLAFTSTRDGNPEIYSIKPDGSEQVNLSNNPANDDDPVWSPDGKQIAFSSDRDGNHEIYVMEADGTDQTNTTNNPAADVQPAWSPDGKWVAFTTNRDGNQEIYVQSGAETFNVTVNPAEDRYPAWVEPGG
jgi:Tol biopolymer transport system component